jgi:uncharacterized protein (TIGR03000 family)
MTRRNFVTTTLATILIASFCLVGMSSSAEAGWGHHRRFGNYARFSYAWPSYRSYGSYYGCASYRSYGSYYGYARYPVVYPVYRRSYVPYYYPTPYYYSTPYVGFGCYGWGYRPWVGFGGYFSANSVSVDPLSSVYAQTDQQSPRYETATSNFADLATRVAPLSQGAASGNIELKLNVPEDARVTINDRLTSIEGSERAYVVRGGLLEDQYPFVVRAEIERNGQTITETKQVDLRGGQVALLSFDLDAESTQVASIDEPVNTTVRLRVPEEAKVYLAGHEMKQKGKMRVFETTQLRAGEELENYTVRVIMGDGNAESREKQLTLVGGETQEVEFDFTRAERLVAR